MIAEKAFLTFLLSDQAVGALGLGIWWEDAPEALTEPFMVLHCITSSQVLQAGFSRTGMQLDVFHSDRFRAMEIADALIQTLWHRNAAAGDIYIMGIEAQRMPPLKAEENVWKVPVEITFNAKEKNV